MKAAQLPISVDPRVTGPLVSGEHLPNKLRVGNMYLQS